MASERDQNDWINSTERVCTSNSVPLTGDFGGTTPVTSFRVRGEIDSINSQENRLQDGTQQPTSIQECDAYGASTRYIPDSLTGSTHAPHSSTNIGNQPVVQPQFLPQSNLQYQGTHQQHHNFLNHVQQQNLHRHESFSRYSHPQRLQHSRSNPQEMVAQGFTYAGHGVYKCQNCSSQLPVSDLTKHRQLCSTQSDVHVNENCEHSPKDQMQPKASEPPVTHATDANRDSYSCYQQVKCPRFADYKDRVNSFPMNWRTSTKTPQEFASAGFYYFGEPDKVACFSCGMGFQDWKYDEKPWQEHALRSPNCAYVTQVKGSQFVEQQQARSNIPGSTNKWQQLDSLMTSGMSSMSLDTTPSIPVDQKTYQILVEMGYKPDIIERALTRLQNKRNQTDLNMILDEISAMNEEKKEKEHCFLCGQGFRNGFTLLPCGHLAVCCRCDLRNIKLCPVCNEEVQEYVRTTIPTNK